jgi:hypothetical protein
VIEQLTLRFDPPVDLLTRLRRLGLPAAVPIHLHQNRRVMLSLDARGGLRVHQGYAAAPDEVVAAIVQWARATRRKARLEAARTFLSFPVHQDGAPPRRRRREPAEPGDEERLAKLGALHRAFNQRWFGGSLEAVPLEISGRMRRKLGHYQPRSSGGPTIAISRRHLRRDGWAGIADTLLHEMVHQWQDEAGLPVNHGPGFRKKAREVGIAPRATAVVRPA